MAKLDKAKERIKSRPTDYKWDELRALLLALGYREIQGSGSRVKFHNDKTGLSLNLHKPHPQPEVRTYVMKDVLDHLHGAGLL